MTDAHQPMLHMIGNAHLDPVWLWRWQEGCAEAIGTCWAAIDRMEEGEGFVFSKGEAHIYAWIEELDPDLFARIRHYVAEGRWVIVNGWWIQPDCNVPSGESVIRQALYGKRWFRDRFGVEVPAGYNVDSFGHPGTFPMLLRHTGSTSYTFMRPNASEIDLPGEIFRWRAPDGSEVTAFRIQGAYNTSKREMPLPEKTDLHYDKIRAAGHPFMCFYGVGNHGGAPTKANIDEIERRIAAGERLKFSDPERFFEEVEGGDWPVHDDELQFHAVGCYAVASALKALNRKAESLLEQAEAAATLAARETGAPYPRETFARLWKVLLFNQFHDTLGGTSLESACVDSARELGGVVHGAELELNAAVRHLARTIAPSPSPEDATMLLVNMNGHAASCLMEAEPWVDKDVTSRRRVIDEDGAAVPFQYADPHGKTTGMQRIAFPLEVPAYGWRMLRFVTDEAGERAPTPGFGAETDARVFETGGYRLEIGADGAIASLRTADGLEVFDAPGHRATLVDDPTDTWGHGNGHLGLEGEAMRLERVRLIEDGAVRKVVEITCAARASRMTTAIVLPEDGRLPVELRVLLDWRERRTLLRLAYPVGAESMECEVPGGWAPRVMSGREVPGLRWLRARAKGRDVVLANDAKYSFAGKDGVVYVTALRSPVFAHHDPVPLEDGARYRYMDQGEHAFTFHLRAAPALSRGDALALAETLNKPVISTPHVARGGTGPARGSWLAVEAEGLHVSTLKMAEDDARTILRATELDGTGAELSVNGARATVGPRALATLEVGPDALRPLDGLERG
ncbi:putative alpha-mannosidase [Oceanicola granulosus HTCC2516]|uniref:Putative alpha-mannosidase n=1 Tax=Oceanicola granulosus (strain ATCC BAA-861 / DSM 15982 / KCTC 12143 / HTCC2516) TaxID=314256 RepID=Q2CC56_OCEGH|nr:alpha-mannosidase [Oceanicola granulosus]EAR50225.1 putative alpha-mannosidase [Oceanicola granulosus HTCC2516]